MVTTPQRLPQRAIEQTCEVINLIDYLLTKRTIQRNDEFADTARRIRRHAERANTLICRAWFAEDSTGDLPPDVA